MSFIGSYYKDKGDLASFCMLKSVTFDCGSCNNLPIDNNHCIELPLGLFLYGLFGNKLLM